MKILVNNHIIANFADIFGCSATRAAMPKAASR